MVDGISGILVGIIWAAGSDLEFVSLYTFSLHRGLILAGRFVDCCYRFR